MYYTVKEVASMFGYGMDTIRRWIYEGNLKAVKVRNHYKIKKEDIEQMLRLQNSSDSTSDIAEYMTSIIGTKEEK